jgi:DNA-binding transcriptional ArsR family regulator
MSFELWAIRFGLRWWSGFLQGCRPPSAGFGISRQGARKHLQVLADAELVALHPKGRDVIVQLDPATLRRAQAFIAALELEWEGRLTALRRFVEGGPGKD